MISRAKRNNIFTYPDLSEAQIFNARTNNIEYAAGKTVLSSYPRRIILELTNACNLHCIMCGREAVRFKPCFLSTEYIHWLHDALHYITEITLMGWGEPTLHPEFDSVLMQIGQYPCKKYICTNGMLLDRYKESIVKNKVDLLSISIDGAMSSTNDRIRDGSSLNTILSNIDALNAMRCSEVPAISFVFCIMKSNYSEIYELIELAYQHNVKRVKLVHMTAFSKKMLEEIMLDNMEELSQIFSSAKKLAEKYGIELELPYLYGEDPAGRKRHADCCMPWRDMFIGSDGVIRPCMSSSQTITDLDTSKQFFEIWNCTEYQDLRAAVNSDNMPDQCSRCYQSSFCNWNIVKSYIQVSEDFAHEW